MPSKPRIILSLLLALSAALGASVLASANPGSVIDFEGLAEGSFVSSVSSGSGISGDVVAGSISVHGHNPDFPSSNAAMIFDATCTGGCTGGDGDLFQPTLGNVLIVSEDLDSSDPDDADRVGSIFQFNFSGWGPGVVDVMDITVLDVEFDEVGDAKIQLFSGGPGGTLVATVNIPEVGNGNMGVVPINASGIDYMEVDLDGSGAIDNIHISPSTQQVTATPTNTSPPAPTATPTSTSPGPTATPTSTNTPLPTVTPGGPTVTSSPTSPPSTATSPPVTTTPDPGLLIPVTGLDSPRLGQRGLSFAAQKIAAKSDLVLAPQAGTIRAPARTPQRIVISSLGVNAYILPVGVEKTYVNGEFEYAWSSPHAFAAGWHMTSAPLGTRGNTVLNGHHNAFGEVFGDLLKLHAGDTIQVYSSEGQVFEYVVHMSVIFQEEGLPLSLRQANAHWIRATNDPRLTLVTCWPYDSNTHRLVVVAMPRYWGMSGRLVAFQ